MHNLSAILVGNMNGFFKLGSRITHLQRTPQSVVGYEPKVVGKPHSHFLVSLARGMGLDVNQIGLASHGGQNLTGPMTEIEA